MTHEDFVKEVKRIAGPRSWSATSENYADAERAIVNIGGVVEVRSTRPAAIDAARGISDHLATRDRVAGGVK